jgi:hypothetical protein
MQMRIHKTHRYNLSITTKTIMSTHCVNTDAGQGHGQGTVETLADWHLRAGHLQGIYGHTDESCCFAMPHTPSFVRPTSRATVSVVVCCRHVKHRSRHACMPRNPDPEPAYTCWAAQRAPDAECSEDLISAIVHMCHVVGGPASGITREEAIAAATFKDELRTYKCVASRV